MDEIAIRKGHTYRIVVSDLERARQIWFGGQGRREEDFDQFFAALGAKRTARLQLAVMDMWRPFRNSLTRNAPHARIVFDEFHVLRHVSDALDEVRRSEYRRLAGQDRTFIKTPAPVCRLGCRTGRATGLHDGQVSPGRS